MDMAATRRERFERAIAKMVVVAGCAFGAACPLLPAFAHQPAPAKYRVTDALVEPGVDVESLTISLLAANGRLSAARAEARPQLEAGLVALAGERLNALRALLPTDAAAVLKVALPTDLRSAFPLATPLEQDAEEVGQLEVYHVDHVDPRLDHYEYVLDTGARKLTLHFAGTATEYVTGEHVRVSGIRIDDAVVVRSGADVARTGLKATALPNTFGAQKTLLILVNFTDLATQPFSTASASSTMFTAPNSVSNYDYEASYQQTWLTGDVAGWYTIPVSTTACDTSSIASYAKQAAANAGYVLSNYTRYVFAFPGSSCAWWGMGSIGGSPSQAWIASKYGFSLTVIGHEMGHNFGLYHSHSLDCGAVSYATSGCTADEYGDAFDMMGGGSQTPHYNAYQKERLGWLNAGISPPLTTVASGSGQYTIGALENPRDAVPRALKISMATSCSSSQQWYYVESRQAKGFDGFLSSNASVTGGVLVHNVTSANGSYLLDMTPATSSWADAALPAGFAYTDPVSGLTITPTSVGGNASTITVTYPQSSCTRAAPSITLNPSGTQYSSAGATTTYSVAVTNNDGCGCPASSFNVTATPPGGWTAVGGSLSGVSPGKSASLTISVTSATNAAPAYYAIPTSAVNATAPAYVSSMTEMVAIVGALTSAVSTDRASYVLPTKGNQIATVQIATTVLSGGSPLSGVTVGVQVRDPNGNVATLSAITGSTGVALASYIMKSRSATGVYTVTSRSTFASSTSTATTTFTVQ